MDALTLEICSHIRRTTGYFVLLLMFFNENIIENETQFT